MGHNSVLTWNVNALPCMLAKFFYFMPYCLIRILPNPDRNLGSTSIRIKPVHLYSSFGAFICVWTLFLSSIPLVSKSGVLHFVHNWSISSCSFMSSQISLENQGSENYFRRTFFRGASLFTIGINKSVKCDHSSLTSRQFKTGNQSTALGYSVSISLL